VISIYPRFSMSSLLTIAIAIILALLYPYIITYGISLGHKYRLIRLEPIDSAQIPVEIMVLMQPWIDRLITYDFQIVSYQLIYEGLVHQPPYWGITLQHSSQQTCAGLMVAPTPNIRYPVIGTFSSYYQDTNLTTVNVKDLSVRSKSPSQTMNHLDRASVDDLWMSHQDFTSSICSSAELEKMSVEVWIDRIIQSAYSTIEFQVKKGELHWLNRQEMIYGEHPWLKFKRLVKVARDMKKTDRSTANTASTEVDEDKLELEILTFLARSKKAESGMSMNKRVWLLGSSFFLFLLASASRFQSIQLPLFILVLLFHELGHVLAMVAFGYRDTTMLFVPWLGALATGKKENASLAEKVWLSLAGPLPGLILGIGLAIVFPNDTSWLKDARVMLISLNIFNLLPIYPLDGGQVVESLIFSRRPYLGIIFQSIGVLILGVFGLAQPILLVFATLIAFGIPHNFRLAKLRVKFNSSQDLCRIDREASVRAIFHYLATDRDRNLTPAWKTILVDSVLDNQRHDRSKLSIRLGLFIFYLISLVGSFAGGLYAVLPNTNMLTELAYSLLDSKHSLERYSHKQIDRANLQLQKNPRDVAAYLQRGRGYYGLNQYSAGLNDANRSVSLNPNNAEGYRLRADIHQKMGDLIRAELDRKQYQQVFWKSEIDRIDRMIQTEPKNVSIYLRRGNAKKMLQDKQGALSDFEIALKLQPNSTEALMARATLEMDAHQQDRAMIDVNRVLTLDPKNAEAYELRASLHQLGGNLELAEQDRKQADVLRQN
jgi:tetratricopeptide (TPR) repeat protein/Zn-dependent protease